MARCANAAIEWRGYCPSAIWIEHQCAHFEKAKSQGSGKGKGQKNDSRIDCIVDFLFYGDLTFSFFEKKKNLRIGPIGIEIDFALNAHFCNRMKINNLKK